MKPSNSVEIETSKDGSVALVQEMLEDGMPAYGARLWSMYERCDNLVDAVKLFNHFLKLAGTRK